MDASAILEKLGSMGVEITISGGGNKLRLNPGAAVSAELMGEVKQHKEQLRPAAGQHAHILGL